jgi:hypothetical protein
MAHCRAMPELAWRVWPLSRLAVVLDERDTLRAMSAVRLHSMTADERNGWVMNLSHDVVPIIGDALAKSFEDHGGQNYVEFHCQSKLGPLVLTLQRRFGKTPSQLKEAAEHESAQLRAALSEAVAALKAIIAVDEQKSLMGIVEAIPAARAAVEKAEGR